MMATRNETSGGAVTYPLGRSPVPGDLSRGFESANGATTPQEPPSRPDAIYTDGAERPDVILTDGFNEVAPPNPDPRDSKNRSRAPVTTGAPSAAPVGMDFGFKDFWYLLTLLFTDYEKFSWTIDWFFPEDQYPDEEDRERRKENLREVARDPNHPDRQMAPADFIHSYFGENPNIRALLDHIAKSEAVGGSYDSIFPASIKQGLSDMTINEVIAWQREYGPKHGSSAAGRYQFMPNTLEGLKTNMGLTGNEKFSPEMQDRLAIELMREKGLDDLVRGGGNVNQFVDGIAEIWQAMKDSSGKGRIDNELGRATVGPERTIELARAIQGGPSPGA